MSVVAAIVVSTIQGCSGLSRRAFGSNAGFTLFEVVVTLAILSVILALVGPSLMVRTPGPDEVLASRVSDARRVATRRGQSVTLQAGPTRIRISPLGICIAEKSGGGVDVDPFTCSIATVRAR